MRPGIHWILKWKILRTKCGGGKKTTKLNLGNKFSRKKGREPGVPLPPICSASGGNIRKPNEYKNRL